MAETYLPGDLVHVTGGIHKAKRGSNAVLATVVHLAGTKMVCVELHKEGRPRHTIMLTSVSPVQDSLPPPLLAVKSARQTVKTSKPAGTCGELRNTCEELRNEIRQLTRTINKLRIAAESGIDVSKKV